MNFKRYYSLTNHYQDKYINLCKELEIDRWIATEKIHGANFGIYYDGTEFRFASRNQFVDSTFYSASDVVEKWKTEIKRFWLSYCKAGENVIFHGELFGPGIQKGVNYSGGKQFMVFDVRINYKLLPKTRAFIKLDRLNIPSVPRLGVGSLNELLNRDWEIDTSLGEGTMEGVVISPLNTVEKIGSEPVGIKLKNAAFIEKKAAPKERKPEVIDNEFLADIMSYVTENRLHNVLSHGVDRKFGPAIGAFMKDIVEEYTKEVEDPTERDNWKKEVKKIQSKAAELVRKELFGG